MRHPNQIGVLLGALMTATLGCERLNPPTVLPPEPDVPVIEPVQLPVQVTARETAPVQRG
jgi:hypothetical protein